MLKKFNQDLIEENDNLLLAISGGIDSMVLFHYLNVMKDTLKIKIAVAHFDHQKRKESFLDCQLVVDTCKKLSIHCYTEKLVIDSKENFHDFAREKRYEFFVKIANKIGANKIVLAHNLNDLAETVLMRLNRGSSFEGYRGILPKTDYKNITIIRPMLGISRKEIIAYQKEHMVQYNEDGSNSEDHYTRNRFRHHILPLLEKENPRYLEKYLQFSNYQTAAYALIEKLAKEFLENKITMKNNQVFIDVDTFNQLDRIIKIEVVKNVVNIVTNNTIELNYTNIQDIIQLFLNEKPSVEYPLKHKLYIYKSYKSICFTNKKNIIKDYAFEISDFGETKLPNGDLVILTKKPDNYYGKIYKLCYNNLDLIFPLTIRNRRNGDKIKTTSGTKKIKDIFINKKIPLNQRKELPFILDKHQEILWIPDIFKQKTSGEQIIYMIYQGGVKNA